MTAPGPALAAADPVEAIARALLYEGYLLWPYRRSARKNRQRFTFGVLYPPAFCAQKREGDSSGLRCEVLVASPEAAAGEGRLGSAGSRGAREGGAVPAVGVELRFLHRVRRQVWAGAGADRRPVDELEAAGELHLSWDEARERRVPIDGGPLAARCEASLRHRIELPNGREEEPLCDTAGALERSWEPLAADVEVAARELARGLWRLRVQVDNVSRWRGDGRDEAQRRSMLSTHLVLRARNGAFVSAIDPEPWAQEAQASCRSSGVWPVLVGEPGARDVVLASPIVLEDHPRVAPESPGDLFDGAEIDQLLTLSILALTDEEKREMASTDPAARAILERTETLPSETLARLHGAFRDPETPR